jgi:predicted Zn finger-like uncharacterized protein
MPTATSLITRCPKCSTAFRVSDEVLSMAKGKVRCGQCFHIFNASDAANNKTTPANSKEQPQQKNTDLASESVEQKKQIQADLTHQQQKPSETIDTRLAPAEEIVNPDWLHTLFDDEDLQPPSEITTSSENNSTHKEIDTAEINNAYQESARKQEQAKRSTTETPRQDEPAPWELELAEVEAALKATPQQAPIAKKPSPKPVPTESPATPEPDYMVALHSLAQTAAEQTRPSDIKNQHTILEQLSAQESLAPLMGESESFTNKKKGHPWLWFFASLLGIALLTAQIASHFFEEGSRSSNFRAIYKTICSYSGCALPGFEDVSAITIQHVRIQSHPSIPNTLLVNAIITNTSDFSQPMPKIALEFFDLNGLPVAARLFSPSDYLHKDFLDITYMPPNTPIHLVIPIQDPGARAVTHQLRAFPTDTRSY